MKKITILVFMAIALTSTAYAQSQDSTSTSGGKLFWGLYKWGDPDAYRMEKKVVVKPKKESLKESTKDTDSTELKKALWGAIQWTRKKEKDQSSKKTKNGK